MILIKKLLQNEKREITLILVSIMVLTLFFSSDSMGKESSKTTIEVNSKLAEPIVVMENSPTLLMDGKKDREYYSFTVKNYKENGEISQIDLAYYIEIIGIKEKSISFKMYKNKQEIPLENNKTMSMNLIKDRKQEEDYQLEIIYDKTKNDSIKDIIQEVQLKIHSEQVKS